MGSPRMLTYSDAIDHCVNFLEGHGGTASQPIIRSAIQQAYDDIVNDFDWPFLMRNDRITTRAPVTTGTIAYDHTGGTFDRQLTLSSSTWPDWAYQGSVRIGDLVSDIEQIESPTVVTLTPGHNPGEDIASGTSYTLYPRYYALPADFVAFTGPFRQTSGGVGTHISLTEMLSLDRSSDSSGELRFYAIAENIDVYGSKALYIYPRASDLTTLDFVYWRRPREIRYTGHDAADFVGTVDPGASTTLTGDTTSFLSAHIGAIIRISSGTGRPTGRFGDSPFAQQHSIIDVAGSTSLTLGATATAASAGRGYVISDPIDLGPEAHNAFLRQCEANLAIMKQLSGEKRISERAEKALVDAMGASSPTRYNPEQDSPRFPFDYTVALPD